MSQRSYQKQCFCIDCKGKLVTYKTELRHRPKDNAENSETETIDFSDYTYLEEGFTLNFETRIRWRHYHYAKIFSNRIKIRPIWLLMGTRIFCLSLLIVVDTLQAGSHILGSSLTSAKKYLHVSEKSYSTLWTIIVSPIVGWITVLSMHLYIPIIDQVYSRQRFRHMDLLFLVFRYALKPTLLFANQKQKKFLRDGSTGNCCLKLHGLHKYSRLPSTHRRSLLKAKRHIPSPLFNISNSIPNVGIFLSSNP